MGIAALDYIDVDDRGVARIAGHRIKVMHLVALQKREGFSTEQVIEQYPHLAPQQIYAAFAYYHANKATVDEQIEASSRYADDMRAKHPNRHTRAELIAMAEAKGIKLTPWSEAERDG